MQLLVSQICVSLSASRRQILLALAKRLRCHPTQIESWEVRRRSLDARQRQGHVKQILQVACTVSAACEAAALRAMHVRPMEPDELAPVKWKMASPASRARVEADLSERPVVVGAGPAGLFAALTLARAGLRPLLLERGAPVETRTREVGAFWGRGELNPESNVLYGEGGAGLFSDGKLTSRSKDRRHQQQVFEALVEHGAHESILVDTEPHVGSDRLAEIVPAMRHRILELGGEVRFDARLENLVLHGRTLAGLVVNGETIPCQHCILATGHSARDLYRMLEASGVQLAPKAFAVGVRLELPQPLVDHAQWGHDAGHPALGAASFRLTRKETADARACYTFCMCPGGSVIACASSPERLTTNGMSLSARNSPFANAAVLVPVTPDDYSGHAGAPLAGLRFQEEIERKACYAGGGAYALPACRLPEFLEMSAEVSLLDERSCARAVPSDLHAILPDFVSQTLQRQIPPMLQAMRGVTRESVMLYAAETRSSSPVRIERTEAMQSVNTPGLFPAGEGAGYAGGIVSSAIDGIRSAEALLASFA